MNENTYEAGQKVLINSHEYAGDYEECGVGIPLGSVGEYVRYSPENAIYPHMVSYDGGIHPLAEEEVKAA